MIDMYSVTIKSLSKDNEVRARWMELDIECWLNRHKDEDRIVYILRSLLKETDCYLPSSH